MAFLVGWVLVALLLVMWSGLVWAVESVLVTLLSSAGSVGVADWSLPEALTAGLPVWAAEWLASTVETLMPQLQSLVNSLPWLANGVSWLAWVVWAGGALLLLVVGVAFHVGVALWRKSVRSTQPVLTARP